MISRFSKLAVAYVLLTSVVNAENPDPTNWSDVLENARGQEVYWHAWGGEPRINNYIAWVGQELEQKYNITLHHVKVDDTAHVVSTVLAEKAAEKHENGSVDLIWINGENFASMKRENLLFELDWATKLPNWKYVDVKGKPTVISDFTIPTDGLESPWGMAQLVFMYDTERLEEPPNSARKLLEWSRENPGKFTYPQPPSFFGTTFLKQILSELVEDPKILELPVDSESVQEQISPMISFLDELHPNLWRSGRTFPQNASSMRQLLADGEIDIAFSNNPNDASNAIESNELPPSVKTFVFENGTIGNTHFVTIPYNANSKEGAMVVANFLISPVAQSQKQSPEIWGDPTVLDINRLEPADQNLFNQLELGIATLSPDELGNVLPEPHPTWVAAIEEAWIAKFGTQ